MSHDDTVMLIIRLVEKIAFYALLINWDGASAYTKWMILLALEIYGWQFRPSIPRS